MLQPPTRRTFARSNTRATTPVPCVTFTVRARRSGAGRADGGPLVERVRNAGPEKRFADPDEIARFVAYLAQPDSTYINGASLTIDGGFSA